MPHRHIISGDGVPTPGVAAYSAAVVAGDHCYVSGQLPKNPSTGEILAGSVAEQTELALDNVFNVLRAAGFSPADLTVLTVLLADIDDWAPMNAVIASRIAEGRRPSRAAYQVGLPVGVLVEIQAVAVRSS